MIDGGELGTVLQLDGVHTNPAATNRAASRLGDSTRRSAPPAR